MTDENSLVDRIVDGLRREVEQLVRSTSAAADSLDETEQKARQFAKACGGVACEALLEEALEAQHFGYVGDRVESPAGGVAMFERYEARWVLTHLGRFRIKRAYYWDAQNRTGSLPLDERWELDEREPSPSLRRSIGMLGAEVPFARGRRLLLQTALVELPEKRLQESSEAVGEKTRQISRAAAQAAEPMLRDANVGIPEVAAAERQGTLYVQLDGGRLNTTTEGWREPKVATLYWGDDVVEISKDRRAILDKEYVAVLGDADELAGRLWAAACRWQWWKAERVVVLGDGAEWIWNRAKELFPDAIQILDRYHAEEHIWDVARQLYGGAGKQKDKGAQKVIKLSAKDIQTHQWARARIKELEKGDVAAIMADLRQQAPEREQVQDAVEKLSGYLQDNRARMKCDEYVAQGLTIGSGAIESGVKNVVNQRMKGCGMRWAVERADHMVHLRAAYLSTTGPGHELVQVAS